MSKRDKSILGFLNTLPEKPSPRPRRRPPAHLLDQSLVLLQCDSGKAIIFSEANMHVLVTGTTGSGKTTSVIIPAMEKLIAAGFCGLIIDVKGNVTERVLALAAHYGREKDILELGVGPKARPINILAGLDEAGIHELIKVMTLKNGMDSRNMYWHMSGVRIITDLAMLCRCLAVRDPRFTPSLSLLGELLTDFPLCVEMFKNLEEVARRDEEKALLQRIKNNHFHPCVPKSSKNDGDTYNEQVEWRISSARNALNLFRQTPGVERGFCSAEAGGLDMEKWIYDEKKIVVLRFGPQSGSTGADLSRSCLDAFYQAVLTRGLDLPKGEYTFMVADEFQEIADFSSLKRINDNTFAAISREANNIFIAGTQSLSALITRSNRRENVEAFVNNCNNLVLMYSIDTYTREVASRHDKSLDLKGLHRGKAAVVKFNLQSGCHEYGLETLQKAHDDGQARLAEGQALREKSAAGYSRETHEPKVQGPARIQQLRKALEGLGRFPKLLSPPNTLTSLPVLASGPETAEPAGSPEVCPESQARWSEPPYPGALPGANEVLERLRNICADQDSFLPHLQSGVEKLDAMTEGAAPEVLAWFKDISGELLGLVRSQQQAFLEERCKLGDRLSRAERRELGDRVVSAIDNQDMKESERLSKLIPLEPKNALYLAKIHGKECLLDLGLNLSLADDELEPGWLDKYDGSAIKVSGEDGEKKAQKPEERNREKMRLLKLAFRQDWPPNGPETAEGGNDETPSGRQ